MANRWSPMPCPKCGANSRVYELKKDTQRRYRKCPACLHKFVTEQIQGIEVIVTNSTAKAVSAKVKECTLAGCQGFSVCKELPTTEPVLCEQELSTLT